MADIPYSAPIAPSKYFDTGTFRNTIHACNIAVHNHFAELIFKGELERLCYASSEFAFRERSRQQGSQNLNLPFQNYRIADGGLVNEVSRKWWNHIANIRGVYVPELGRNIRFTPVTIKYDSTLFVHKDLDAMFALSELFWDDSNETQLKPVILIEGEELALPANLKYNLQTYSNYAEEEWLKSAQMSAIKVNMEIETVLIKDKAASSIPSKIILDFAQGTGMVADTYEGIIDQLNETVDWTGSL